LTHRRATCGLKVRRKFSVEMQTLIIFLRFGSIINDQNQWLRPRDVEKRTGVKVCSQVQIIDRWRKNGFRVINRKNGGGVKRCLT